MNSISYQILPSPEDNTHQVRLIVDGIDWIGESRLGLDPPDICRELRTPSQGAAIVARCTCGVIGCDDLVVEQTRTANDVSWTCSGRPPLRFSHAHFDSFVQQLNNDHTWEPIGRTAERQLNALFAGRTTDDGFLFDWASTRITDNIVVLSVTRRREQKLLEFSWNPDIPESALTRGKQFLHQRFDK